MPSCPAETLYGGEVRDDFSDSRYQVAFVKTQLTAKVVWVGVQIELRPWEVIASIPMASPEELDELIAELLSSNVVTLKALRSIAGRCTDISTLLYMWRPFLSQLVAAPADRHETMRWYDLC